MQDGAKTVLGIDASLTSTGVAVIRAGELLAHGAIKYIPVSEDGKRAKRISRWHKVDRLRWARDEVLRLMREYKVSAYAVEAYAFSRHSSSVTGLAELGGVFRVGIFEEFGLLPLEIPVSMARKFMLGKGNAKKKDVQKWLKSVGWEFDTDDEADAFVVGMAAFYAYNPRMRGALALEQLEHADKIAARLT